jgi:hypothetical protein
MITHILLEMRIYHLGRATRDNVKTIVNNITMEVAETMSMIETGRELFIDGKFASEPTNAYIVMSRGYCKIAMYVTSANLVILIPFDMDLEEMLKRVVGKLTTMLTTIDNQINDSEHERWIDDSQFNATKFQYVPTPSSIENRETNLLRKSHAKTLQVGAAIEKRIFSYEVRTRSAAFRWNIHTMFDTKKSGLYDWVTNKTTICLDFTSQNIHHPMDVQVPTSPIEILRMHGVMESRVQFARFVYMSSDVTREHDRRPILLRANQHGRQLCNKISSQQSASVEWVLIKSAMRFADVKLVERKLDIKTVEGVRIPSEHEVTRDIIGQCQVCSSTLWELSFAIEWDDHTMSGICPYCLCVEKIFVTLSMSHNIHQFNHPRKFDKVASEYNLPVECGNAIRKMDQYIQSIGDCSILMITDITGKFQYRIDELLSKGDNYWVLIATQEYP